MGIIFGAVFGVLFAPRKGKELRQMMRTERKKGKLGIAPLQGDLKKLGQEIVAMAKDLYASEAVQEIVVKGRKKLKSLSDDFVGDVTDFHITRIKPFADEVSGKVEEGKKHFKKAKHEFKDLQKKVKTGAKISKKAFKEIKAEFKKKS